MNSSDNIQAGTVIDDLVVGVSFMEEAIPTSIITDQQANVLSNHFPYKLVDGINVGTVDGSNNNAAIALSRGPLEEDA